MPTATATTTTATTDKTREVEVTRVGNLTKDPELQFGKTGTAYSRFGLAVEVPKQAGNWAGERETVFYQVTVFGSLAEHVAESLHKGDRVIVSGKGRVERWRDKSGEERVSKVVVANSCGPDLRWCEVTITRDGPTDQDQDATDDYGEEPF